MTERKAPVDLSRFRALADRSERTSSPIGIAPTAELSRFIEDPNNPRTDFGSEEFKSFVEDVREHGVLQPVVVVPQEDGRLMIRWGARRLRAARAVGLPTLPYVLQMDQRQSGAFAQISENEQRSPLTPMDLARFVERMIAQGMQKQEIARKLRKDAADITHLVSLATAPGFILELYESGKCRQPKYLYDLRKLWEKNPKTVQTRCAQADSISRQFIEGLRRVPKEGLLQARSQSALKQSVRAPITRPSGDQTQPALQHPLVFEGRRYRLERGLVVLICDDETEHEFVGESLSELLRSVTT